MTEPGGPGSVHELSQYTQISLSKIHQNPGSVQAVFLEQYAVHRVAVPVGAQLLQIAGVRFRRKPCVSLRTLKPQNCEDLGGDQVCVAAPPLECVHRKQKPHTLSECYGVISRTELHKFLLLTISHPIVLGYDCKPIMREIHAPRRVQA